MDKDLNIILKFLNDYANLILVVITAIYAFMTFRMASLMKRQIVAHIRISKAVVKSGLLACRGRNNKDILLKEIVDKKIANFKNDLLAFRLSIDVYNSSSGSGSIDQPKLILTFRKIRFKVVLRNRNEGMGTRETIYMQGGDLEKRDFDYFLPYNKSFLKNLQKYPGDLEYWLRYKDNFDKIHKIKINKVEPLS